jgi:hypothetical protein
MLSMGCTELTGARRVFRASMTAWVAWRIKSHRVSISYLILISRYHTLAESYSPGEKLSPGELVFSSFPSIRPYVLPALR